MRHQAASSLQDLVDVDYLRARMAALTAAFPEAFVNHAMAVKANSIRRVAEEPLTLKNGSKPTLVQGRDAGGAGGGPGGRVRQPAGGKACPHPRSVRA